jgi:hypothetical protein
MLATPSTSKAKLQASSPVHLTPPASTSVDAVMPSCETLLVSRKLVEGFARWWEAHSAARNLHGALMSTGERHLSRAWNSWRASRDQRTLNRSVMRCAFGHLTNRQLSHGWNAWVEFVLEMTAYLDVVSMQFSHVIVRHRWL